MKPQIPWLRVFVEGVVIVGSLLLLSGCGSDEPTELPTLVSLSMEGGEGTQFTAIATWSDGATEDVTTAVEWTSSDTSVLTISVKPQIPWLRVFIEGVVIVGSILLAFGVDAWWEGQPRTES